MKPGTPLPWRTREENNDCLGTRPKGENMRHYYAKQHSRGFANECDIHRFSSRAERDAWVEKHRNDGDVNSASQGAEECTAAEARRILGRKSDALTEQYNDLIAHDIPEDDDEGSQQ